MERLLPKAAGLQPTEYKINCKPRAETEFILAMPRRSVIVYEV